MSIRDAFEKWKDYLWIIIGAFIAAAGINIFIVPYKIAPEESVE